MSNFLKQFPDQKTLSGMFPEMELLKVNAHIHTPYSYSSFTDIAQIFKMAVEENVSVVGINDFFVTEGYKPFYDEAKKTGVFPLFNIELIGLLREEQLKGIRINDPNNPGRCYFTGKGLNYPFTLKGSLNKKLLKVIAESQSQVKEMIGKANDWFNKIHAGIFLTYEEIRKNYAKDLVRERHLAKAIRHSVFDLHKKESERIKAFTDIFDGKPPKSSIMDIPGLENEIRGNLLKSGGKAFVEENETAFMELDEIIEIIVNGGGIPCYPLLLDDEKGNYTEFEQDSEKLYRELVKRKIGCIELIPGRNDAIAFENTVNFFNDKGFIILFGTEHNTPKMLPLTPVTRDNKPLSAEMQKVSYEGACVVAAHQYLHSKGMKGFTLDAGKADHSVKKDFIELGNAVIQYYSKLYKKK